MEPQVYTHATWRVKPGEEDDFVAAWDALAEVFSSLPARPRWGTLIRSIVDPSVFFSFGPWHSAADVEAMRSDPRARAAMERVRSHCIEATPEMCALVRHVRVPGPEA